MVDPRNDRDNITLSYPKVTLAPNTHVYNEDKEVGLKIAQMRNTTLDNFRLLAEDLLAFLEKEATKASEEDPDAPMVTVLTQPMFATGETLLKKLDFLAKAGFDNVSVISIVAAPQGVDLLQMLHPNVQLFIAHLDDGLNWHGEIIPGLGENGHRLFDAE